MRPEANQVVEAAAREAAKLMRDGLEGRGHDATKRLVDGLAELLADARPEVAEPIGRLLADVVAAQERGDTSGLVCLLEHELLPLLRDL